LPFTSETARPMTVTRLHVERLAQGEEQGGPCVERDRALRERRIIFGVNPMVLVNASRVGFESAGTCSGFRAAVLGIMVSVTTGFTNS
jgi:hypothetical protein